MNRPFLIDDDKALRAKLNGARGSLRAKWVHFQMLAQHQSAALPLYPAFVGLITGNGAAVQTFRQLLEAKIEGWPSFNRTIHMQYHGYCCVMAVARWAIAYDWVADHPALRGFDVAKLADTLLDALYAQTYPVMRAREPASNNQIAAMLLSSLIVGHLFGEKRGRDPRARFLFQYALERVHELTELAAPWFVGEGSTYIETVNIPVSAWFSSLMAWLGLPTDHTAWTGVRRLGWGLIGPGGLSLPWDNYGYHRSFGLSGLALLARETRAAAPLAAIDHLHLWHGVDDGAWGEDTRLWTLVWWPDDAPDWPAQAVSFADAVPSWMHPRIGGALQAASRGLRVFQAWDHCEGAIGGLGRYQADANAITLDLHGSPLIVDGVAPSDCTAFDYDPQRMLSPGEIEDVRRGLQLWGDVMGKRMTLRDGTKAFAHGCVGGANGLVLNREPWHFPRGTVEGCGTLWVNLPGLQAVGADCTAHYRQRYPVNRIERLTFLVQGEYAVTLDRVVARQPVHVTWQVFTRPDATRDRDRVGVSTPEGPRLFVTPENAATLKVEPVPQFPRVPNGRSARVSWSWKTAASVRATLLWPEDDHQLGPVAADWEGGWLDDRPRGDRPPRLGEPKASGPWLDVVEALAAAEPHRLRWLRWRAVVPAGADYLRLLLLNRDAKVWLNGQPVTHAQHRDHAATKTDNLLPWVFVALPGKALELLIVMASDRGRLLVEPGMWYARRRPSAPSLARLGNGNHWRITNTIGSSDAVVADELMDGAAARACGIRTDAQWVLRRRDGHVYALAATRVEAKGLLPLRTVERAHAFWDGQAWHTASLALPNREAPTRRKLERPPRFAFTGQPQPLAPAGSPGRRVAAAIICADVAALEPMLRDEDFRVRMAAAERLGELGAKTACPALRQLLDSELGQDLYPEVKWEVPVRPWAEEMVATGRDIGVNRYRVAQSVLTALWQLRDRQAAPFARAVLNDPRHFYPLHHRACVVLGDLGSRQDISLLQKWCRYPEVNTQIAAQHALARLAAQFDPSVCQRRPRMDG